MKMTLNRPDAEDIFQDTFIKYADKYPMEQSPALLYTIARNIFLDKIRKKVNKTNSYENAPVNKNSPEECLISKNATQRILSLLKKLPEEDRELLSMAGSDGLAYSEIAKVKNMTVANIKVRIYRARLKLKTMMEAEDE